MSLFLNHANHSNAASGFLGTNAFALALQWLRKDSKKTMLFAQVGYEMLNDDLPTKNTRNHSFILTSDIY